LGVDATLRGDQFPGLDETHRESAISNR